jgi:Transposase IS4
MDEWKSDSGGSCSSDEEEGRFEVSQTRDGNDVSSDAGDDSNALDSPTSGPATQTDHVRARGRGRGRGRGQGIGGAATQHAAVVIAAFPRELPSYAPLTFSYGIARKERPLMRLREQPATALSEFEQYFSPHIIQIIVAHTNKYAKCHGAGSGRPSVDVTSDELKQRIGILVYIGLFPSPSVLDYWCTGKEKPIHRMSSIMSLTRFQQLKRFLHISDPDDTSSSTSSSIRLSHS